MNRLFGGVTTLGVALLLPAASCAASTILLSGVSTVTQRIFSFGGKVTLATFQNLSEPQAMLLLGGALFVLATLVRLTAKKRAPEAASSVVTDRAVEPVPIQAIASSSSALASEEVMRANGVARLHS